MGSRADKSNEKRNISRVDIEETSEKGATRAWQVRFKREGKKIVQFFSDSTFGSEEQSLNAAKLFRDAIEAEFELQGVPLRAGGPKNTSGIIGVNRTISTNRRKGYTYSYPVWQASWQIGPRKRVTKKFFVSKLGEEEALRQAIEARRAGIAEYQRNSSTSLFIPPENETSKIWRYMDFTKFVSMLENKGLFFPRSDNLGDPFEGSFSKVNQMLRPLVYKHVNQFPEDAEIGELVKRLRNWVVISCWHMSDYESAGMWNLYARTEEAICIQSTYDRLISCIPEVMNIGLVRYVDYRKDWIPESNLLAPFIYKRKSFEHEKELRAIINLSGLDESTLVLSDVTGDPPVGGIWHPVDLNTLIEKIYVAPYAPNWFSDLVRSVVRTYGLDKPIINSSLDDDPIF